MTLETGRSGSVKHLPGENLLLLAVLLFALLIGAYFPLRYRGQWMESDSVGMLRFVEDMRREGTLQSARQVYNHGFAYQVLSLSVAEVTGLPSQTLQTVVFPVLGVMGLGLIAFALYSQAARSRWVAALATLFLLLQPDLLFVTMRGSHEKLDWPLLMLAVLLFYRSVNRPPRTAWAYIGLFYVTVFALATVNVFFASSFLIAIVASLLLGRAVTIFHDRRPRSRPDLARLILVSLSCGIVIFIFMVYLYPPALDYLRTLGHVWDQTSALVLGFQDTAQPYASIPAAWLSQGVYLGLTAFTWLLIALSFVAWLWRGKQILLDAPGFDLARNLDWLLYAGFAIQVALGIAVDLSGTLSSNLQLRVFPGFVIWAVLLLARAVWRVFGSLRLAGVKRRLALGLVALAVAWFAVAALCKATNEPVLGNWWLFYTKSEDSALSWADGHVGAAQIWTGIDSRIAGGFVSSRLQDVQDWKKYDSFSIKPHDRYLLLSEGERFRSLRMGIALPSTWDWNRLYDNGQAFVAHRRPRTPFQR